MVERWNGMPQVLPPVWLFSMKAGKKLASHVLSSAVFDEVVERHDRVLVDQRVHVGRQEDRRRGRRRRLVRRQRLDDRVLVGAGVDRLHLDAGVLLLEVGGHLVDDLGDRAADGDRVVERDLGLRERGCGEAGECPRRSSARRCGSGSWCLSSAVVGAGSTRECALPVRASKKC